MTAEPIDMGDVSRRNLEQMQLRTKYFHLFAPEMQRLEAQVADLEARNSSLLTQLQDAQRNVNRLETIAEYDARKKERRAKGNGFKKGQRNRVVFHVKAKMRDQQSACLLGQALMDERGPDSGKSMKVTAWGVDGSTLGFVVDYTVVGGHPADVWRDGDGQRPGMLNRTAARLAVEVLSVECKQHSRERVEDAEMLSEGS